MIKKNGDGTYRVTYSTRNKFGKKIQRKRSGISSHTEAKRVEADLIYELKKIKDGFDYAGLTFMDFVENHYWLYCISQGFSDADNYIQTIRKWGEPIARVKIDAVTPNDIESILNTAKDNIAYSTLKKLKSFFNRTFEHACKGGLNKNPCNGVRVPKSKVESECKVLTRVEANYLLKMSRELQPLWYKIWAFHLLTGVRSGEGYALNKTDIDLEQGNIMVNKSWNKKKGIKSTKNGQWRNVPISKAIKPLVIELLTDTSNGNILLPHPYQWTKGDQARVIRGFCSGIRITPIRFHDLRATFITQLFKDGASIAEVQAVVGHTDLKTTQRYLRLAGVDVKGVTDKLNFTMPSDVDNVISLRDRMEIFGT